jgi:hypothetical protein
VRFLGLFAIAGNSLATHRCTQGQIQPLPDVLHREFDHFMPNKGVGAKHSISAAIVPRKKPVLD